MIDQSAGPATSVAIVAGQGDLPRELAEARRAAGLSSVIIIFPGCQADWMSDYPSQNHEFERAGALFRGLKSAGVTHIVFAGAMTRPKLRYWRVDWTAAKLALRATRLLGRGDDVMLRGFGAFFEENGFTLIGSEEILGERLLISAGPMTRKSPDTQAIQDAVRAAQIVSALAPLDVGQGAVVAGGLCLGIETIGGTDQLLECVSRLPEDRRRSVPVGSGVLFKATKQGQDRRMDLPAIGPQTIEAVAKAGLAGVVLSVGEVLVLQTDATRAAADRLGLFIYGATRVELDIGRGG